MLRRLLPLVAVGFLLRALVPVGYMPAAPGTGLLFELCHEGMPAAIMMALAGDEHGHAHHGHHGHDGHHGSAESGCSIGHLLTLAMIDAVDSIELNADPGALPGDSPVIASVSLTRRYASPPRGPPHSQIPLYFA